MNRARITYRFDQVDEDNPQQQAVSNEAWSSPIDLEVQRLEELIRSTEQTSGPSAPPKREEEFAGDGLDKHDRYEMRGNESVDIDIDDAYVSYRRLSNRVPWLKMIITVFGAVLTGIVLGMLVLSLFNHGQVNPFMAGGAEDEPAVPVDSNVPNLEQPVTDGNAAQHTGQLAERALLTLPSQIFQILQVGVFGTLDSASQTVAHLRGQGLAAALEQGDQYHVYAGISPNRDDVLGLKKELESRDLETYIKTYEIPQMKEMEWGGASAEMPLAYFMNMNELIRAISGLTLVHLQEQSPTAFTDTTMDTILSKHKAMMLAAVPTAQGVSGEMASEMQKLNNEMNTAVDALAAYGKNPSRAYLWQAQNAIMQVVLAEKRILTAV